MNEDPFFISQEIAIKGIPHVISAVSRDYITYHYKRGGPALLVRREYLLEMVKSKLISFSHNDSSEKTTSSPLPAYLSDLPEEQRNIIVERRMYVEAMLAAGTPPTGVNARKHFVGVLKSIAEKLNKTAPSLASAYRWLKRYMESGGELLSLKPNFDHRGNRTDRLPHQVRDLMDQAIEEWLTTRRPTMKWVYGILVGRIVEINGMRDIGDQLPIPAYSTFVEYTKRLDPVMVSMRRKGKSATQIIMRTRAASGEVIFPFQEVQFDHTPLDLIVVGEDGVIYGRPFLTIGIDKLTKVIGGFHVSFTPPSYITVMRCLANLIKDKSYVKEKYPDIKNEWLVSGVPTTIVTDNGSEFLSADFAKACKALEISVVTCPPGSPWFKASAERYFRTMNLGLVHNLPGTTKSNIFDKGDYDAMDFSVITLKKFNFFLHKWTVDIYMQSPHTTIATSPAIAWRRATEKYPVRPLSVGVDLDIVLGKTFDRKINNGRVQIYNIQYSSPVLSVLASTQKKPVYVVVKMNPENLGAVFVLHPVTKTYFEVQAIQFKYANELPLHLHKKLVSEQCATTKSEINFNALYLAKLDLARKINAELKKADKRTRKKAARHSGWAGSDDKNPTVLDSHSDTLKNRSEEVGMNSTSSISSENDDLGDDEFEVGTYK